MEPAKKNSVSLHAGTFFERKKCHSKSFCSWFTCGYIQQHPMTQAARESKAAKGTAVDVYQWLREICSWRLINHDIDDMTLGGSGAVHTIVVQV